MQKTVFTSAGLKILLGSEFTVTKAALYSTDLSDKTDEEIEALTTVDSEELSQPIFLGKNSSTSATQRELKVLFTNSDQDKDINFYTIGWFASGADKQEALIAVSIFDKPVLLPAAPPGGLATSSRELSLIINVANGTTVKAVADPAGVVSHSELNEALSGIKVTDDRVNVSKPLSTVFKSNDDYNSFISSGDSDSVMFTSFKYDAGDTNENFTDGYMSGLILGQPRRNTTLSFGGTNHLAEIHVHSTLQPDTNWSEQLAFKSDVKPLQDTIDSQNKTIAGFKDTLLKQSTTIDKQAETIGTLQAQIKELTNQISYIKANYIEGKVFAFEDKQKAIDWEDKDSQKLAIIKDKETSNKKEGK